MLVGLHGESRAGKDSVAKILRDNHEFEWRSFADKLRCILLDINPPLEDGTHLRTAVVRSGWDMVKELFPSSVEMLISLGQSARDVLGEDVWLTPVLRYIPPRLVISDVRQPNEFEAIKKLGGEIWLIKRNDTTPRGMDHLLDGHTFDAAIWNNSTIADLEIEVAEAVKLYGSYHWS